MRVQERGPAHLRPPSPLLAERSGAQEGVGRVTWKAGSLTGSVRQGERAWPYVLPAPTRG